MRFFADGPSIPDELLEERDQGRVVFFCGAGISIPAGLPSFSELASRVMDALGTAADAESKTLFEQDSKASLDRVFNHLYQEYRRDEVDHVVKRLLRTPRRVSTKNHETILRIAQNARRRPQVVTTNFDLIFERARPSLQVHIAPALPNIASLGSFSGLVYLHGRLVSEAAHSNRPQQFVLSSSDFGRAYLANGWATNFVRDLLQTYVIVLIGYSVGDPPVRYLLEGLKADPANAGGSIYAFDRGTQDAVSTRWASLGVRPIAYGPSDHLPLWRTLEAWAGRADDPDVWRRSIVAMAHGDPKQLQPHQRGQVAALVRTRDGAAQFASADTPPPAEWLCVFDRRVRYPSLKNSGGDADPLQSYGLDDDPLRDTDTDDLDSGTVPLITDILSVSSADERTDNYKRLAGVSPSGGDRLSKRLGSLQRWFTRIAGQPAALWWAAGNRFLHPEMLAGVHWALRYRPDTFSATSRRAWALLLQHFEHPSDDRLEFYYLKQLVSKEGWNPQTLRAFGRVIEPRVIAERPWGHRLQPPSHPEGESESDKAASFKVAFLARHGETIQVPTESLPSVFEKLRVGLQLGSELLAEVGEYYWQTTSFHPASGGDHYPNDASQYLQWARQLFDRLVKEHARIARAELHRWPRNDRYFFDKLRIYGWSHDTLMSGAEVAEQVVSFWQDGFWNEYHRRELLHSLRTRWKDFAQSDKQLVEERILTGPDPWQDEEKESFEERKRRTSCAFLGWLERQNCDLSPQTKAVLEALRTTLPDWNSMREERADHSFDIRVGSVATDAAPGELLAAPIPELTSIAQKNSAEADEEFTRHEPFQGLVEQLPRRAFLALSFRARRRHDYPLSLWQTFLGHWPMTAAPRLRQVCAARICELPDKVIAACLPYLTRWFRTNAVSPGMPLSLALRLFDRLVDVIALSGPEASQSGIGEITLGGKVILRSRRTREHAINSAPGELTDVLLTLLQAGAPKPTSGVPPAIRLRMERLIQLGGDGADYAVAQLMLQIHWLFSVDPSWVKSQLIPFLKPSHQLAEPAWNGYLDSQYLGSPRLFASIKSDFLEVFKTARTWQWGSDGPGRSLGDRLVTACYFGHTDKSYLTYAEARKALRYLDEAGRAHVLWVLSTAFKDKGVSWGSFGKLFIQRAWPKEKRFQTPSISESFASLAERADDDFPHVVETVLPFLVPVPQLDMIFYRALGDAEESIANRFPESLLVLIDALVPPEPPLVPHELGTALDAIAGARPSLRDDGRWRRLRLIANRG